VAALLSVASTAVSSANVAAEYCVQVGRCIAGITMDLGHCIGVGPHCVFFYEKVFAMQTGFLDKEENEEWCLLGCYTVWLL
jgi:hypothetical protein